jgi:hypothetical protein
MSKRLEIMGELPSPSPSYQRIRAKHLVLGREVEMRLASEPGREGAAAPFVQEMLELSYLDHPVFPPVLERGAYQGRYYYAVPLRAHRPLSQFLTDGELGLGPGQRRLLLRQLASALAAAHMVGLTLPPPRLDDLTWDPTHEQLHLPHPRLTGGDPPDYLEGADAERPEVTAATQAANVSQWAALAYAVLGDGQGPFAPAAPAPGQHLEGVEENLVGLIDGCLFGEEESRPSDAAELLILLQVAAPVRPDDAVSASSIPALDPGALKTHQDLKKTLADLRSAGAIPRADPAQAFGEVLGKLQDRLASIELPAFEPPSATPKAVAGVAAIVLLTVWFMTSEPAAPPPPPPAKEAGFDPRSLAEDPYVKALASQQSVAPPEFARWWRILRTLSNEGRLPPGVADQDQLMKIYKRSKEDPQGACAELELVLESLRKALGHGP